jgi:hypothetical protein
VTCINGFTCMLLEPSERMELEQLLSDSCAWGGHGEAADWVLNLCTEGFALHGCDHDVGDPGRGQTTQGSVQSPKQVFVVDSLPITALGKPDKKALRAKFWEDADRAVG